MSTVPRALYLFLALTFITFVCKFQLKHTQVEHLRISIALRRFTPHEDLKDGINIVSLSRKISTTCSSLGDEKSHTLLYLSLLLLVNASDVELNPGPRTPKYPCQICSRAVTWKQRGVACDDCQQWYHADCMHMSTPAYMSLNNVSWHCVNCGMPNFATSLFESFIVDTENSFSHLDTSTGDSDISATANNSISSASVSPGPPMSCSSPVSKSQRKKTGNVRLITVNFQSAKNKKEEIANLIDSSNPTVIIGTETWLNSSVHNTELFPPSYDVIRKDRSDGWGGVLLAIKKDFIYDRVEIDTDAECIFARFTVDKDKTLIIGSMYRPTNNDTQYLEALCSCTEKLVRKFKNAVVWIGGDLNLPDINWDSMTIEGHQYPKCLNERFLEFLQNCGLQQIVTFPTRGDNKLDLFLTNRPSLVNKCAPLPGIGDHEIVYTESDVTPQRCKPVKRKIHLWKKASIVSMKEECFKFQQEFLDKYCVTSPVHDMWFDIKSELITILDNGVPSKVSSTRVNQPWITRSVKRLTRRKKRSFNKARKTKKDKDFQRYQQLKKATRSACKQAYSDYLNNIISPESSTNPKKFWGFIKSKKCDNSGVSPLKAGNGVTYSDSMTKAYILNEQFSSVFNKNEDKTTIKNKGSSPFPSMDPFTVSTEGVQKLLDGLNIHKASGPDGIPSRLLKELSKELAPVLALFFQASIDQGVLPEEWKEANVVPIFKKGERNKAENYRPVSLT